MGNSQTNVDFSVLGRSLLGKSFRTKGSSIFSYYAKEYHLARTKISSVRYAGSGTINSSKDTAFEIEVTAPIEFKVLSVNREYRWSISTEYYIELQILNDLSLKSLTQIVELNSSGQWIERPDIYCVESTSRPAIRESRLQTQSLRAKLNLRKFGTLVNENQPYSFFPDAIELLA